MKNNVRSKISGFLKSEEGRVGVKSPLTLGIASASVMLVHAMVTPSVQAHLVCDPKAQDDCGETMVCMEWCGHWDQGTCTDPHAHCELP